MVACLACWCRGNPFSINKYVMSDAIDDVQNPRYLMRRWTFFNLLMYFVRGFACTWTAPRARNPSPSRLATMNPKSTRHGPRLGPTLGCWVRAGSLRATEPRARGKTCGRNGKKCRRAKKHIYTYVIVYIGRVSAVYQVAGTRYRRSPRKSSSQAVAPPSPSAEHQHQQ